MQLISPNPVMATTAAPLAADAVWRDLVQQVGLGKLALLVVALQVISVVALWLASGLFCRPNGTFKRAVITWASLLALSVAAVVITSIALPIILSTAQANRYAWLAIPALGLLAVVAAVTIPMKIYEIDGLRSCALLLVHTLLAGAVGAILQFVLLGSAVTINPHFMQHLQTRLAPTPIPDPEALRRRLNERLRALNQRWEQLEIRHRHLPPHDAAAAAAYDRDKAMYDRDVEQLKLEAAALPR